MYVFSNHMNLKITYILLHRIIEFRHYMCLFKDMYLKITYMDLIYVFSNHMSLKIIVNIIFIIMFPSSIFSKPYPIFSIANLNAIFNCL